MAANRCEIIQLYILGSEADPNAKEELPAQLIRMQKEGSTETVLSQMLQNYMDVF